MKLITAISIMLKGISGCFSKRLSTADSNKDATMSNATLADATFKRILKAHGDSVDPSKIPKPQQTVILVFHSHGIIGNGGFQYLFSSDFPGDAEFLLTRQAYKTIGASEASAAFAKAFAVFPNSIPPANTDRRLEMWQSKYTMMDSFKDKSSPDSMYFDAMNGVMEKLDEYIRLNEAEFASLPK